MCATSTQSDPILQQLEVWGELLERLERLRLVYRALACLADHPNHALWLKALERQAAVLERDIECLKTELSLGVSS